MWIFSPSVSIPVSVCCDITADENSCNFVSVSPFFDESTREMTLPPATTFKNYVQLIAV
jgi:hypothetical protein